MSALAHTGIGILRARQGRYVEAIRHQIVALSKRSAQGESFRENAEELYEIRVRIGRKAFADAARTLVNEDSMTNLTEILDARPPDTPSRGLPGRPGSV
ncbi:hypothetical protein EDC02_0828 [Micromonospora sp. Llam0]|uniref:hypothetical protein n=1 Tax=Micromonospora sp. Llam0 TaxID=2485143 RepID=UPI000F48A4AE|nr:hypothetical protein [Micromonospora sp. Llam0]ROO59047.1 hypothetical protein EDC02_0828 [Micromonospora sp. Llam0]